MSSVSPEDDDERSGFLSYLNPLSYFTSARSLQDEEGELKNEKVVSVFGYPVFVTESADDLTDEQIDQALESEGNVSAETPEESEGFFSSVLDSLNPF